MARNNEFEAARPSFEWPPSPRVPLWEELERLHQLLGLPAPYETLTIEQLEAQVTAKQKQAGEKSHIIYACDDVLS